MATDAQMTANRANAQSSTGPATHEGKSRSAANAQKHGLSSAFTILPNEDKTAYETFAGNMLTEFKPEGEHETFLVWQMIQSRWNLTRAKRLEAAALNMMVYGPNNETIEWTNRDEAIIQNMTDHGTKAFSIFQRYAAAAERSYYKAHRQLEAHRKDHPPVGIPAAGVQSITNPAASPELRNEPDSSVSPQPASIRSPQPAPPRPPFESETVHKAA